MYFFIEFIIYIITIVNKNNYALPTIYIYIDR